MKELQNGRSMIEMLGVLAIIGVLSIGGLAGYTMAMNRHRANNIIDYASKCAVIAQTTGDGSVAISPHQCQGTDFMNQGLPAAVNYINVARAANGNTNVEVNFTAVSSVSSALGSRLGVGDAATFCFSPEFNANGGWQAAACATPSVGTAAS